MCNDREKLIAYLYDEASASERRQVDVHLAECGDCRDELRAFRSVRQDLLAWDVPTYESVWKPFVTTPVVAPWWKQVPAWGLAAAAMLIFGIGLAGGFAGRALASRPVTSQAQTVVEPGTKVSLTAATADEVRALQERLAAIERVATNRPESATTVAVTSAQLQQLLKDTEGRIKQDTTRKLLTNIAEMQRQRLWDQQATTQQINEVQQQINANLYKVATRGAAEKEKEQ